MPWFPEIAIAYEMAVEGKAAKLTEEVLRSKVESLRSGLQDFAHDGPSPPSDIFPWRDIFRCGLR